MIGRTVCTVVGALVGAFFGAGTGVVGAFGGISGLAVFAAIGGVIGFFATSDIALLGKRFGRSHKEGNDQCKQ